MLILNYDAASAAESFAAEYYIASELKPDEPAAYIWTTPPTVMIGKYQNVYAEVNLPYIRNNSIAVSRRMSGGGAIYTDRGCVQYSVIGVNGGENQIEFSHFTEPVAEFLRGLGIDAVVSGRNDICADGKKLSGSAQYITGGVTVHHGSLLFKCNKDALESSLSFDEYKVASKGIRSNKERVINISELMPSEIKVKYPDTAAFMSGIVAAVSGGGGKALCFTEADIRRIRQLENEYFEPGSSVFGQKRDGSREMKTVSCECRYIKTVRTDGGTLTLTLEIDGGIIKSAVLSGNFFASADIEKIFCIFTGTSFQNGGNTDIIKKITDICKDGALCGVYGVREADLYKLFGIE